jgi:endonuclease/exonuclease/phosphatase family metal-dependent hydrolase
MIHRRLLSIVPLAVLLTGCAATPKRYEPAAVPPSPPDLVVVAWNMKAGRGDLPRLLTDLVSGRLTGARPRDYVLLLQEAVERDRDTALTLERVQQSGLSTYFAPVREVNGGALGNAIVASQPLTNSRTIPLPRERQPRAAVAATVIFPALRLFVVSVHLENRVSWRRGGLFSDSARGRQAAALIAALPADEPGIVGGDLNTWLGPSEPAWRLLLARFTDTPPTSRSDVTFRRRLILDHLFFDLPGGWHATRRALSDAYGSDHLPVLGVITRSRADAQGSMPTAR